MDCESCGLVMERAEDHGGAQVDNKYCKYCAPEGTLLSRERLREGWVNYLIKIENINRAEAEKKVDATMSQMPAWKEETHHEANG